MIRRLLNLARSIWNGHLPHECEHCWHVLPSQRSDYHRGVSRFYLMIANREEA